MNYRRTIDLDGKSSIDLYNMVIEGTIPRFPSHFWNKSVAKEIILYLYGEYSKEQLLNLDFTSEFKKKKIVSAYKAFEFSIFDMLSVCFPEYKIKVWELKKVPDGCWENKDNVKDAVNNMMQKEKAKTKEQICQIFSADLLRKHGLKSIMEQYSLYEILRISYPEYNFLENDLNKLYKWTNETAIKNIKYLIEDVLKWDYKQICENISTKTFRENGLDGLLSKFCNNSVFKALELAYPGRFQKSDLKSYVVNKRTGN